MPIPSNWFGVLRLQPAHDSNGPKRAYQMGIGHFPPLLLREAPVSHLGHRGLGRIEPSRLPACASGHERPDDESERSWEGLKQVEEGLPQCR